MIKCSYFAEKILPFYKENKEHRTASSNVYYNNIIFNDTDKLLEGLLASKLQLLIHWENNVNVHYPGITYPPTPKK